MSDVQAQRADPAAGAEDRAMVLVVYGLYLFALFSCGLAGIAGVVVAYVKRGETRDPLWLGHYDNQINTFWVWFALAMAGMVALPLLGAGLVVLAIAFVWFMYRTIKGLLRALESRPYT